MHNSARKNAKIVLTLQIVIVTRRGYASSHPSRFLDCFLTSDGLVSSARTHRVFRCRDSISIVGLFGKHQLVFSHKSAIAIVDN